MKRHNYPGIDSNGEFQFTSDCSHGCGCWMGSYRSGGPEGVNPFGECPNAPDAPDPVDTNPKPDDGLEEGGKCGHGELLRNPCVECDNESFPEPAQEPQLSWDPRLAGDAAKIYWAQSDKTRATLESFAVENPSGMFNVGFQAGHAMATAKFAAALEECHAAFRARKHGGVAESALRHRIEEILNKPYD